MKFLCLMHSRLHAAQPGDAAERGKLDSNGLQRLSQSISTRPLMLDVRPN